MKRLILTMTVLLLMTLSATMGCLSIPGVDDGDTRTSNFLINVNSNYNIRPGVNDILIEVRTVSNIQKVDINLVPVALVGNSVQNSQSHTLYKYLQDVELPQDIILRVDASDYDFLYGKFLVQVIGERKVIKEEKEFTVQLNSMSEDLLRLTEFDPQVRVSVDAPAAIYPDTVTSRVQVGNTNSNSVSVTYTMEPLAYYEIDISENDGIYPLKTASSGVLKFGFESINVHSYSESLPSTSGKPVRKLQIVVEDFTDKPVYAYVKLTVTVNGNDLVTHYMLIGNWKLPQTVSNVKIGGVA